MQSESIENLSKALVQSQSELGPVVKDSQNPFFKSNYASVRAVIETCRPTLNKNGISFWQGPKTIEGSPVLVTKLIHESGEWIESHTPLILSKNDMQQMGSAITYARRYGLAAAVGIFDKDDDGNSATNFDQRPQPTMAPQQNGPYRIPFGKLKGKTLSGIPAHDLRNYEQYLSRQDELSPAAKELINQINKFLK